MILVNGECYYFFISSCKFQQVNPGHIEGFNERLDD